MSERADRRIALPVRQVELVHVDDTDAYLCDKNHPIPMPRWLAEMRLSTIGRVERPEWPDEGKLYEGRYPYHLRCRAWHLAVLALLAAALVIEAALSWSSGS